MPETDKPQVTVPSDEELREIAENFRTLRSAQMLLAVVRQVRDRTRAATRSDTLDEVDKWCDCGSLDVIRAKDSHAKRS